MEDFTDPQFEEMMQTQILMPSIPNLRPCIVISDKPLPENQWFAFFLVDTPMREKIEKSLLFKAGVE